MNWVRCGYCRSVADTHAATACPVCGGSLATGTLPVEPEGPSPLARLIRALLVVGLLAGLILMTMAGVLFWMALSSRALH